MERCDFALRVGGCGRCPEIPPSFPPFPLFPPWLTAVVVRLLLIDGARGLHTRTQTYCAFDPAGQSTPPVYSWTIYSFGREPAGPAGGQGVRKPGCVSLGGPFALLGGGRFIDENRFQCRCVCWVCACCRVLLILLSYLSLHKHSSSSSSPPPSTTPPLSTPPQPWHDTNTLPQ